MRLTTFDHDGDDYAPHVDADTTTINGAMVPVMTGFEYVAYMREIEEFDRNADVSADDVTVTPESLELYLYDYDQTETYPLVDHDGHDGLPRFAIVGPVWQTYNGPNN